MTASCSFAYLSGFRFATRSLLLHLPGPDGVYQTYRLAEYGSGRRDGSDGWVSTSHLSQHYGNQRYIKASVVDAHGRTIDGLTLDLASYRGADGRSGFRPENLESSLDRSQLQAVAREQIRTLPYGLGDVKSGRARLDWAIRNLPDGHIGAIYANREAEHLAPWLRMGDLEKFTRARPLDSYLIAQTRGVGEKSGETLRETLSAYNLQIGAGVAARALKNDGEFATIALGGSGREVWYSLAPGAVRLHELRQSRYQSLGGQELVVKPCADAEFEQAVRRGERPEPVSWSQRAMLAGIDKSGSYCGDAHPLVRAAAFRSAPMDSVRRALRSEKDEHVMRAAAVRIAEENGCFLHREGIYRGSGAGARPDIIFVDVDGTLVDGVAVRDGRSITEIRRAGENGVIVVAVTGRSPAAFSQLDIPADMAVCDGEVIDYTTGTSIERVSNKGEAVNRICEILSCSSPAAVGDGQIDVAMFKAVRERGGRCGWVSSGQRVAAVEATDIVGAVGSGGVGRFVRDLCEGNEREVVQPVQILGSNRATKYASYVLPLDHFETLKSDDMVPEGWAAAHGHTTLAYPSGKPGEVLPEPEPGARLQIYGKVRSETVTAYAVRIGEQTEQPNGTPLHITVGLSPTKNGHVAPVEGGRAVKRAIERGEVEILETPIEIPVIAAKAGCIEERIAREIETRVAETGADLMQTHRAIRGGIDAFAGEVDPVQRAVEDGLLPERGMVVLVGAPASGKSTVAYKIPNSTVVSLDSIRGEINGDESSQERLRDVVDVAEARMRAELALGRLVVSDATNLEERVLKEHVERAHQHHLPAVAVYLDVSREEAMARDLARHTHGERAVGSVEGEWRTEKAERVFDKMYQRWEKVSEKLHGDERLGFDGVVSVNSLKIGESGGGELGDLVKELENLLREMDIPTKRVRDYGWILRNLPINNQGHPNLERVMRICLTLNRG